MKKVLLSVFVWAVLLSYSVNGHAQANQQLSNLTAKPSVAINQV
jgi:hypothetical protein